MSLLRQGRARLISSGDWPVSGAAPPKKVQAGVLSFPLSKLRPQSKRIAFVVLAGVGLGVATATLRPYLLKHAPHASRIFVVPVPVQPTSSAPAMAPIGASAAAGNATADELERLRTRNRRLEALIQILRKRSGGSSGVSSDSLAHARSRRQE
jgi:hypothetical protein